MVKSGHGQACTFHGEGEGLDGSSARQEADNVAPPAQEAPRVSEGSGLPRARPASTRGRLGWRLARTGERESPQMELGARWTPHAGAPPSLALLRGGFACAGVCNQKVQRPFRCASISPCEIQITSFAEKGLIAKGTRQREFCWLFSLKKITVLSLSPQQIEPSRNWAVIPRDASLPSSSL